MKKSMIVWVMNEAEMDKLMLRFGITEDDVEASETYLDGLIRYAISVEESKIPEIKEYQAMKLMVNEKVIQAVAKAKNQTVADLEAWLHPEDNKGWYTCQITGKKIKGQKAKAILARQEELMEWITEQIENAEAEELMEWVTEQIEKYGSKGSEQPAGSH
jgi:hypothetical protein